MFGRKKDSPQAVICKRCGNAVADAGAKFCNKCGAELNAPLLTSVPKKAAAVPEPERTQEMPKQSKRIDLMDIEQLIAGFSIGKISNNDWSVYEGEAEGKVQMLSDLLIFDMRVKDRRKNHLRYGFDRQEVWLSHNNIAHIQREGGGVRFIDPLVNPDIRCDCRENDMYSGRNSFTFFTERIPSPVSPGGPADDIEGRIKQLTEGFRKQKFDGWTMHKRFGEASIAFPIVGGYLEFAMAADLPQINRLRCFRYDCEFILQNIKKMSKNGCKIAFYSDITGDSYDGISNNSLILPIYTLTSEGMPSQASPPRSSPAAP